MRSLSDLAPFRFDRDDDISLGSVERDRGAPGSGLGDLGREPAALDWPSQLPHGPNSMGAPSAGFVCRRSGSVLDCGTAPAPNASVSVTGRRPPPRAWTLRWEPVPEVQPHPVPYAPGPVLCAAPCRYSGEYRDCPSETGARSRDPVRCVRLYSCTTTRFFPRCSAPRPGRSNRLRARCPRHK